LCITGKFDPEFIAKYLPPHPFAANVAAKKLPHFSYNDEAKKRLAHGW
jgi:hypothetical protein